MPLLLSETFYSDPRVLQAGNRAIGSWVQMLSWLALWPDETSIHPACRRMFRATPLVVKKLVDAELLVESECGLEPLGQGELWKKYHPSTSRPKIPDRLRALVMERDEYRCQKCSATEKLSLDHILPYSMGGPHTEENLRVLCRSCNSARGNRMETVDG